MIKDDVQTHVSDELVESEDSNSKATLSTKLERRRRIEDLDEDKRLRAELNEF